MLNNEHTATLSNTYTMDELKEDYIDKIVRLLRKCNDISLLDLIKKLLEKSVQHLVYTLQFIFIKFIQSFDR